MTEAQIEQTAKAILNKYTLAKPIAVEDAPDAHTVWLKLGDQSFCLSNDCESKDEADWTRLMLARALARMHNELLG